MKIYNTVHLCAISGIINDILSCSKNEPFWKTQAWQYAYEEWKTYGSF